MMAWLLRLCRVLRVVLVVDGGRGASGQIVREYNSSNVGNIWLDHCYL